VTCIVFSLRESSIDLADTLFITTINMGEKTGFYKF